MDYYYEDNEDETEVDNDICWEEDHQRFHVPYPCLDAAQDVMTILCDKLEISNCCSETELQLVFLSSCHTSILVYTVWHACPFG